MPSYFVATPVMRSKVLGPGSKFAWSILWAAKDARNEVEFSYEELASEQGRTYKAANQWVDALEAIGLLEKLGSGEGRHFVRMIDPDKWAKHRADSLKRERAFASRKKAVKKKRKA